MTISITTISINAVDTECFYAECQLCWMSFMLSVTNKSFMLSIIMLKVIILNVMLNVVAPLIQFKSRRKKVSNADTCGPRNRYPWPHSFSGSWGAAQFSGRSWSAGGRPWIFPALELQSVPANERPGNPNWRGWLSTMDLPVLTGLDQLLLILQTLLYFFDKTSYL